MKTFLEFMDGHPARWLGWTLVATALLIGATAFAADVTATWTHPTQYTDNSALPLASIRDTTVQYGTCTTATTPTFGTLTKETIVPAPATSVLLPGIVPATYCFRAKTTDLQSRVSAWSVVVQKAIMDIKPKPPTTITITFP